MTLPTPTGSDPDDQASGSFPPQEAEIPTEQTVKPAVDLSPVGVMIGWRPISKAPKDGTKIILWRDGWRVAPLARWDTQDADEGCFGGWFLEEDSLMVFGACEEGFIGWNEDIADGAMPTHWCDLPALPIATGEPR